MVTTLYLVRHGEADESVDDDPALSPLGAEQARALGRRLASTRFHGVLHSSRRRARETAAIIAESIDGCTPVHSVHADDRTPVPSDMTMVPASRRAFFSTVPADERDLDGRDLDLAIDVLGRGGDGDGTLLVVTHNFVIGWFVRAALEAPAMRWMGLNSANCGLTVIRYAAGELPRLVTYNDTGHLAA